MTYSQTLPSPNKGSDGNPGRLQRDPKNTFWWLGFFFKVVLVLMLVITVILLALVYKMLYINKVQSVDMEAINNNQTQAVTALTPRSSLGETEYDKYVFVPNPQDQSDEAPTNENLTPSQDANEKMDPYVIGEMSTNAPGEEQNQKQEAFREAPTNDPSFLGDMNSGTLKKNKNVPIDPTGQGSQNGYDTLF